MIDHNDWWLIIMIWSMTIIIKEFILTIWSCNLINNKHDIGNPDNWLDYETCDVSDDRFDSIMIERD